MNEGFGRLLVLLLAFGLMAVAACAQFAGEDEGVPFDDYTTNPAEAIYLRGLSYTVDEEYDKAIVEFTKIIQSNPQNSYAYRTRGQVHFLNEDYDKAISDYNRAVRLSPESVEAYLMRGIAFGSRGDYDRGIADFSKVIELKPDIALAYYLRGVAYADSGDYDSAIGDFERALELEPEHAQAKDALEEANESRQSGFLKSETGLRATILDSSLRSE